MLKIHNVRLGLACNSSSSHSLIFLNEGEKLTDESGTNDGWFATSAHPGFAEFGWNFFTAASPELKQNYLAIILREMLRHELPDNFANAILENWLGKGAKEASKDGYIDHQSRIELPCAFGTRLPDEEFFVYLRDFLLNERVVILGGNDNDSNPHHHADKGVSVNLQLPVETGKHYVCRHDPVYNYWTLFSPEDGAKVRLSLTGDMPREFSPEKAFAPELIDIKITDFCPFGCKFCYQGSTTKGGHANLVWWHLASELKDHKVFEVALGGGEPTLHPEFSTILETFKAAGVVPNFTTRNLNWLNDSREREKILDNCGAFAFSTERAADILQLGSLLKTHNVPPSKANVQIVMGLFSEWQFREIAEACYKQDLRLTLLGYKTNGRGESVKPKEYSWWLNEVQKLRRENKISKLCIDTAIAAEYEQEIIDMGIPRWLFHTQEGKFSMYYDAVRKLAGPSSYCDEDLLVPWDVSVNGNDQPTLQELFVRF